VCVAFYKNERLFGSDATALMGRKPEVSIAKIFRMLGRGADHPAVKELKSQYFPYNIYQNETTGHTSISVDDAQYTPEELLAMVLQNVKDMTANFGGKGIKDCVLTVPAGFTQHEREALYTAAEIADLKVLSLIEENTAAALHYGIDRVFDQPSHVLYYNMGAGSTQVSIVTYSSVTTKEAGKNKTVGQFEIVGKAWDDSLGGFYFDMRLTDLLAQRFNDVWSKKPSGQGKDLRDFPRPMTRLRIEANKVKEVLSANNEFPVRAEQLHANVDLVTKVSRADFEAACSDLWDRVTSPIDRALRAANLTIKDLHAVELLGGGVRVPKVKKLLEDYFKAADLPLGQHLNGDEAMALGAAFRAANLSTAFRVRKVGMTDTSSFGVSLRLENLDESSDWSKHTSLYPAHSSLPAKVKTVAFHHDQDISCRLEYDAQQTLLPEGTSELLAVYNVTGVAAFAAETENRGAGAPKLHLSFGLDASGVVQLLKAEATLEYEEEEPVVEEKKEEKKTDKEEAKDAEQSATPATKKSKKVLRRVLTVKSNLDRVYPPKWSAAQIAEAKQRLRALQQADEIRRAKAAAMNDLETYLYKVKNRLMDEETQLKSVSTEDQRQEVQDLANSIEEWLYDDGRDQEVPVYTAKQSELRAKAESIFHRYTEVKARAEAVSSARKALTEVRNKVSTWPEKMPHITSEESESLLKLVETAESWMNEKESAQSKVSPFEKPAFDSSEVAPQLKPVSVLLDKLMRKPKPAPTVPAQEKNETVPEVKVETEGDDNTVKVEREPEEKTDEL
jgi:hypoxia up-regulated 1